MAKRATADVQQLDQQLCFALYAASRAVTRAYGPLLAPHGLTYPQYLVLMVLWESDGLSVKALGERLGLDSGTLTPLLKRLETGALLVRSRDEGDTRVVRVQLTAKGRRLKEKLAGVPAALAGEMGFDVATTKGLGELVSLRDALHALVGRVEGEG